MARMMLALMLYFLIVAIRLRAIPCQRLLEVYEDLVEILLMLQLFLAEDPEIEYLFYGAPSGSETYCSSAMTSSACGWSLFRMIFSMTLLGWLMRLMVL